MDLLEFHLFDVGQWFVAINSFKPHFHRDFMVNEGDLFWFESILSIEEGEGFLLAPWGKGGKPNKRRMFIIDEDEMKDNFLPTADELYDTDADVERSIEMPGEWLLPGEVNESLLRAMIREELTWKYWQRRPRNSNIRNVAIELDDTRRGMHNAAIEDDLLPAFEHAKKAITVASNEDELIAALEDNGFPIEAVVTDGTVFSGLSIGPARKRMQQFLNSWVSDIKRDVDDDPGLPLFVDGGVQ